MSAFREAVRTMTLDTLRCPKCGAENKANASRTINVDQKNQAECSNCSHVWTVQT